MAKKSAAILVVVLLVVLLGVPGAALLAVFAMPATLVLPWLPQLPATVEIGVAGPSTLARGRALITSPAGTDSLRWHWCPGSGVTALCFRSSGHTGFLRGVLTLAPGWVRVRELAFTGVESEILRLPALPASGPLSGHLDNLNFPMGGDCLHLGLVSAIGEVQVAELGVIAVSGDGEQRVRLAGDLVSGEVTVLENSISGVLQVALQPGPGGKGNFAEINVARPMACQP